MPAPLCDACPDWPRRFSGLRSAAPHVGAARSLVAALKYGGRLASARPLGILAAGAARTLPLGRETLVAPVPLHARRRRRRGLNQADEIARVVARELRFERRPRLLRRIRPEADGPTLTARGRGRVVRGAFRAREAARGRIVLLVDDVAQSGATLGSCARALFRAGARDVWAVTATRAP